MQKLTKEAALEKEHAKEEDAKLAAAEKSRKSAEQ